MIKHNLQFIHCLVQIHPLSLWHSDKSSMVHSCMTEVLQDSLYSLFSPQVLYSQSYLILISRVDFDFIVKKKNFSLCLLLYILEVQVIK